MLRFRFDRCPAKHLWPNMTETTASTFVTVEGEEATKVGTLGCKVNRTDAEVLVAWFLVSAQETDGGNV